MPSVLSIDGYCAFFAVPAVHHGYLSANLGRECQNITQLF